VEAWMLQHLYQWWMGRYQNDSSFVDKFSANTTDTRTLTDGQTKEIKNIGTLQMDMRFRNLET
jgi:hypothetical protein